MNPSRHRSTGSAHASTKRRSSWLLFFALASSSCSHEPDDGRCSTDADCKGDRVCDLGECRAPDDSPSAAGTGGNGTGGVSAFPDTPGGATTAAGGASDAPPTSSEAGASGVCPHVVPLHSNSTINCDSCLPGQLCIAYQAGFESSAGATLSWACYFPCQSNADCCVDGCEQAYTCQPLSRAIFVDPPARACDFDLASFQADKCQADGLSGGDAD
jgi:hypothetical protein